MIFNFLQHGSSAIARKMDARENRHNEESHLRILSHNVGQDLPNYSHLDTLIRETKADIVFLQEITRDYIDGHWQNLSQHYPHRVYGPFLEKKLVASGILSLYPIVDVDDFKLAESGLVFQQHALILIKNTVVSVYNIHLTFPWIDIGYDPLFSCIPWPRYNSRTRNEEIANLVEIIDKEHNPLILAGDFNLSDRSADYKKLAAIVTDAYRVSGVGTGFSWPANRTPSLYIPLATPFVRIDYIFHSPSFHSNFAKILRKTGSDHLPLLVDMMIEDKSSLH